MAFFFFFKFYERQVLFSNLSLSGRVHVGLLFTNEEQKEEEEKEEKGS